MYHGIVVGGSLGKETADRLKVIGKRRGADFLMLKVEVEDDSISKTVALVRKSLKSGYYAHFYGDGELIVVFQKRVFRIKPDKKTWKDAVAYGLSLGIPEKQLDFSPCRPEDETW